VNLSISSIPHHFNQFKYSSWVLEEVQHREGEMERRQRGREERKGEGGYKRSVNYHTQSLPLPLPIHHYFFRGVHMFNAHTHMPLFQTSSPAIPREYFQQAIYNIPLNKQLDIHRTASI